LPEKSFASYGSITCDNQKSIAVGSRVNRHWGELCQKTGYFSSSAPAIV